MIMKRTTFICIAICASVVIVVGTMHQRRRIGLELLAEKQRVLEQKQRNEELIVRKRKQLCAEDAEVIVNSVVISGDEDYGDYVAYLSTMVDFYKRYEDLYSKEYVVLKNQLEQWEKDRRALRSTGEIVGRSSYEGLRGLVNSTRDHLRQIADDS